MSLWSCLKFSTRILAGAVFGVAVACSAFAEENKERKYSEIAYGTFDFNRALEFHGRGCDAYRSAVMNDSTVAPDAQKAAAEAIEAISKVKRVAWVKKKLFGDDETHYQIEDNDVFCREQYPKIFGAMMRFSSAVNMQTWHARSWLENEHKPSTVTVFGELGDNLCFCGDFSLSCIGSRKAGDLLDKLKKDLDVLRRKEQQIEYSGVDYQNVDRALGLNRERAEPRLPRPKVEWQDNYIRLF